MIVGLFGILLVGLVLGLIPAIVAKSKGRSFVAWWVFGAAMFIVALPVVLCLGPNQKELDRRRRSRGEVRCPECAGWIPVKARTCMHCRTTFEKQLVATPIDPGGRLVAALRHGTTDETDWPDIIKKFVLGGAALYGIAWCSNHSADHPSVSQQSDPAPYVAPAAPEPATHSKPPPADDEPTERAAAVTVPTPSPAPPYGVRPVPSAAEPGSWPPSLNVQMFRAYTNAAIARECKLWPGDDYASFLQRSRSRYAEFPRQGRDAIHETILEAESEAKRRLAEGRAACAEASASMDQLIRLAHGEDQFWPGL